MIITTNLPPIVEVEDLTLLTLPGNTYVRASLGKYPKIDLLVKSMFNKPGQWFAFNDAIYGKRPGKFCYEIEGRLNVLAVDSVKYKIEWAYQHTLTYLLPPDYYLYAFRVLLLDSNGDLLPIT